MPGMIGRKGYTPTCHTEMGRWIVEHGHTMASVARTIGVHPVTVQRHCLGWPMSATLSRLYRAWFPGIPCPLRGAAQLFEHPLPLRAAPAAPRAAGALE